MRKFIKKYYIIINLLIGVLVLFLSLKFFRMAISLFYEIDKTMALFAGVIILLVSIYLFKLAYNIQDEVWYRKNYEKTGDDFENKFKK